MNIATTDPTKCHVNKISPTSVAGIISTFTVHSRDKFNNLTPLPSNHRFEVSIEGPEETTFPTIGNYEAQGFSGVIFMYRNNR